ncbi:hypothetical protein NRA61_09930 [Acinetobacter baumannii]|nr:hypothetical protein [Acinetobacter baumannii]
MDKPMTFNEWMGKQGNLALVHANCCRIAYEAGQQSMQAKVEELQEEFAEDERFLKEQIKDKDQKISNLECQQGMDKELIQALQGRSKALQDKVNDLQKQYDQHDKWLLERNRDCNELYNINAKHVAEKAELQKRVDAALKETQFALQYVEDDMRGNHEFLKMAMIRTFKVLEQALKGEGQ